MQSFVGRTKAAYRAFKDYGKGVEVITSLPQNHAEKCRLLRSYYDNTAYQELNAEAVRRGVKGLKFLDNPAYQAVEFHAAHLFPGTLPDALPLQDAPESLEAAIRQVWAWSNWASEKQVYARTLGICGEAFIKAVSNPEGTRFFKQLTEPEYVTDLEEDERGYLVFIRLDFPVWVDGQEKTHTEVWSKEDNEYLVWPAHSKGVGEDLDQLGEPDAELSGRITDLGIDFVPFVHAKFQDIGNPRGSGVFEKFLGAIDEQNRAVNRLHETYFRYDRPLTALRRNEAGQGPATMQRDGPKDDDAGGETEVGNEMLLRLPGTTDIAQMVPNIPYDAGLKMIEARHDRLAEHLSEIRYYQDVEGDPSGLARRVRLAPATSRGIEARGNAEAAAIRATQMCLTLGSKAGVFRNIGTFEAGSFDFSFKEREILPLSHEELLSNRQKEAAVVQAWHAMGLLQYGLEQLGMSEKEAQALAGSVAQTQRRASVADLLGR